MSNLRPTWTLKFKKKLFDIFVFSFQIQSGVESTEETILGKVKNKKNRIILQLRQKQKTDRKQKNGQKIEETDRKQKKTDRKQKKLTENKKQTENRKIGQKIKKTDRKQKKRS